MSDPVYPEFSVPQGPPVATFGDLNVLAADKLAQPNRPKPKRTRKEPKVYIMDNVGPAGQKFVSTNKDQNDAAYSLDQAIQMGLIKPEHVNKNTKLDYNTDGVIPEPAPFETEKPVTQNTNQVAEQKIAQAVAQAPVQEPVVQEPVNWEDPTDNMTPEELIQALGSAIAYERECGEKIKLIDQNGQVVTGLQLVREKPQFIGM